MKRVFATIISVLLVLAMLAGAAVADTSSAQRLEALYTLANSYISAEDYASAEKYLKMCLNFCDAENNADIAADVHLKLGCVYTINKDYEAAKAQLDAALAIDPTLYSCYMVKAQGYTETEEYGKAIESLEYYIELTGDDTYKTALADLYKLNGDAETGDQIRNEYEVQLADAKATYEDGAAKLEAGDYTAAAEAFMACANDTTYGTYACYFAGVCLINTYDYANALNYLETALIRGAEMDGIYYNCGLCRMMLEDYANAVIYFTASINVESYAADAYYNRAVCYLNSEMYDEAANDYSAYISLAEQAGDAAADEDYYKAIYYRGMSRLLNAKYAEAAADFTVLVDAGYETGDSITNRALCNVQSGSYEAALKDAEAGIAMFANVEENTYYRAISNANLGNIDAAIADLTALIDAGYNVSDMYYQRAEIYLAIGDTENYLADLESYVNN